MAATIGIGHDTVQETLVIPLYARKLCAQLYPGLFQDQLAVDLCDRLDYDFGPMERAGRGFAGRFGALEVACRQAAMTTEVTGYLRTHPNATVVNLGCGLDQTGEACDNGTRILLNLDLPDVIDVRDRLIPADNRTRNVACDLNAPSWMDLADSWAGTVVFAAGVLYYLTTSQVQALVRAMAERLPGALLVFDAAGRSAVRMMLKTWIKTAQIKDVGAYFSVEDAPAEMDPWAPGITVSQRPFMFGYLDLHGGGVTGPQRLLAHVMDGPLGCKVVTVSFGSEG